MGGAGTLRVSAWLTCWIGLGVCQCVADGAKEIDIVINRKVDSLSPQVHSSINTIISTIIIIITTTTTITIP